MVPFTAGKILKWNAFYHRGLAQSRNKFLPNTYLSSFRLAAKGLTNDNVTCFAIERSRGIEWRDESLCGLPDDIVQLIVGLGVVKLRLQQEALRLELLRSRCVGLRGQIGSPRQPLS